MLASKWERLAAEQIISYDDEITTLNEVMNVRSLCNNFWWNLFCEEYVVLYNF